MPEVDKLWEARFLIYCLGAVNSLLGVLVVFFLNELYKGIKECSRGLIRLEHDLIAIKVKLKLILSNGGNENGHGKHSGFGSEGIQ